MQELRGNWDRVYKLRKSPNWVTVITSYSIHYTKLYDIWYFRSLPNKIGYLLGLPTKKLDSIIYYERYVVINPGIKLAEGVKQLDFLTEEEYLDILDTLPKENQYLDDDDPQKFVAKMGAEALYDLLNRRNNFV